MSKLHVCNKEVLGLPRYHFFPSGRIYDPCHICNITGVTFQHQQILHDPCHIWNACRMRRATGVTGQPDWTEQSLCDLVRVSEVSEVELLRLSQQHLKNGIKNDNRLSKSLSLGCSYRFAAPNRYWNFGCLLADEVGGGLFMLSWLTQHDRQGVREGFRWVIKEATDDLTGQKCENTFEQCKNTARESLFGMTFSWCSTQVSEAEQATWVLLELEAHVQMLQRSWMSQGIRAAWSNSWDGKWWEEAATKTEIWHKTTNAKLYYFDSF